MRASSPPVAPLFSCRRWSRTVLRRVGVAALAALAALTALAAPAAEPAPRLTGIVVAHGRTRALLEIPGPNRRVPWPIQLEAGERVDHIEVKSIDAKAGTVFVQSSNVTFTLGVPAPPPGPLPVLNLKDADARVLMRVHQDLTGRTLIASPTLPAVKLTLQTAGGGTPAAAADVLAQALRDQGVFLQARSAKFTFATEFSKITRLAAIPEPPESIPAGDKAPTGGAPAEPLPPGLIRFSEAAMDQVLDVYQELAERTVVAAPGLPPARVTLVSQSPMTRPEAVWMLEAALYLGGISVVREGKQFAFAVPGNRYASAPKVPDHPDEAKLKTKPFLPPGQLKFSGDKDSAAVLQFYAELVGRQPILDPVPPPGRFIIKNQTSLHAVEAVYALDALAALNSLRFLPVGEDQVKLIRVNPPVRTPKSTP